MYKLENWSVGNRVSSPYLPPELGYHYLQGNVYGNPKFTEGEYVNTSAIVSSEGRIVTTKSGSKYELGKIESEYAEYLKKTNYPLDDENPIKVK